MQNGQQESPERQTERDKLAEHHATALKYAITYMQTPTHSTHTAWC